MKDGSSNNPLIIDEKVMELIFAQQSLPGHIQERTDCDVKDMYGYLPLSIKNVIDLGCGSGRVSIGLNYLLKYEGIKFWLVDSRYSELKKHWGQYSLKDKSRFYNKEELTRQFCTLNNLRNYEYIGVDEHFNWSKIPLKSEVLFSKYAFGWHFPIGLYNEVYPKILRDGAICFFTIRHENENILPEYKLSNLPSFFEIVDIFVDSFHWTGKTQKVDCGNGRRTLVLRYKG